MVAAIMKPAHSEGRTDLLRDGALSVLLKPRPGLAAALRGDDVSQPGHARVAGSGAAAVRVYQQAALDHLVRQHRVLVPLPLGPGPGSPPARRAFKAPAMNGSMPDRRSRSVDLRSVAGGLASLGSGATARARGDGGAEVESAPVSRAVSIFSRRPSGSRSSVAVDGLTSAMATVSTRDGASGASSPDVDGVSPGPATVEEEQGEEGDGDSGDDDSEGDGDRAAARDALNAAEREAAALKRQLTRATSDKFSARYAGLLTELAERKAAEADHAARALKRQAARRTAARRSAGVRPDVVSRFLLPSIMGADDGVPAIIPPTDAEAATPAAETATAALTSRKETIAAAREATRALAATLGGSPYSRGELSPYRQWDVEYAQWRRQHRVPPDAKVFIMTGGFEDVRISLRKRGWHENTEPTSTFFDLKWALKASEIDAKWLREEQIVNHFSNAASCLTTKLGLYRSLRELRWHADVDTLHCFPRCYDLNDGAEHADFVADFRTVAATAALRRVAADGGICLAGVPSLAVLRLATGAVRQALRHARYLVADGAASDDDHSDDAAGDATGGSGAESGAQSGYGRRRVARGRKRTVATTPAPPPAPGAPEAEAEEEEAVPPRLPAYSTAQWESLLACRFFVDGDGLGGKSPHRAGPPPTPTDGVTGGPTVAYVGRALAPGVEALPPAEMAVVEDLLARCARDTRASPQASLDGARNVWILKPAGKSRGRGIHIFNTLPRMEACIEAERVEGEDHWIVQKYIEQPMLVAGRKFDIRQWVLVTGTRPLTVWFYGDCYLRFCAEDFSLDGLENNFVHLSNNSIAKYSPEFASSQISDGNMWTVGQFKDHLTKVYGSSSVWEEKIQKAMKDIAVDVLACAADQIESRKATCELFGYDFMVDENLNVWLIEVNCSPSLEHSTTVTETLCKAVVDDIFKVIVDVPAERARRKAASEPDFSPGEANYGAWECIHRAEVLKPINFCGTNLVVRGSSIRVHQTRAKRTEDALAATLPTLGMSGKLADVGSRLLSARSGGTSETSKGTRRRRKRKGKGKKAPLVVGGLEVAGTTLKKAA